MEAYDDYYEITRLAPEDYQAYERLGDIKLKCIGGMFGKSINGYLEAIEFYSRAAQLNPEAAHLQDKIALARHGAHPTQ